MKKSEYLTYDDVRNSSLAYFKNDQLAAEVFAGKYALKLSSGAYLERTPTDMHERLAKEFARVEGKYPNAMSYEEIFDLFSSFDPVTGQRGMGDVIPQGSPMSAIGNSFQYQSLSNCFVIESPYDSYGGIMKTDQEQAQIMKRRGGVGFDISTIRPRGLLTANAARTTDGIGVFMDRFSSTCREVAQGGRRGALMLSISVHHPEIRTFINIKRDKKKVTGANISIRLTDEFMTAVKHGTSVQLRFPVEKDAVHQLSEDVDARQLWTEIIDAAHFCAEPGLLFWDTITTRGPADAYPEFRSTSTNPCIVGDTLIAVADGRNAVSIRQLASEGLDVPVYSTNPKTGQLEIKWGRSPRQTKKQASVWKLTLDDGSTLVATPDHRILTSGLDYVELQNLKAGDSIVPFYSFDSNGYRQISNSGAKMVGGSRRNRRQYRLIHEFWHGIVDPKVSAIHHADFNSLNDNIQNLCVMSHEEHRSLHAKAMTGSRNPYHRMTRAWRKACATHPGETNGRYSGFTNEDLLAHGRELFSAKGKITNKLWLEYSKEKGLPQFLGNDFRFGSWTNFANQVSSNHKVVSVESYGTEDVFNITVDDNHNYHVITSTDDSSFVTSSGICVKNCGEITLSPSDSCRLMLINLYRFVIDPFTSTARFDFDRFDKVVQQTQRLMDDLIDLEIEAVDRILGKIASDPEPDDVKGLELSLWQRIREAAVRGRRTGLGITALGDALAGLNIRYGTDASVVATHDIYRALALGAYRSTVQMAQERGAFPVFSLDIERNHPFLQQIMAEDATLNSNYLKYGRRNIALTTTAPAGSVSILTQTTSGCEPVYKLSYTRRKKHNPSDMEARADFVDELGDKWQHYTVFHHHVQTWMEVTGKTNIEESPYWKATSADIDWVKKIDIQAAAQKWICHSISNTTNIPQDTTVDTVKDIYMRGWETGCKGVTVYREGSRDGVLFDEPTSSGDMVILDTDAPKRPKSLPCDINRANVKGESYLVLVGKLKDRPYELFCGLSAHVEIPKRAKEGRLVKSGKNADGLSLYNLEIPIGEDDQLVIKDIVTVFDNPTYGAFTRTISLALRHGVPVKFLVEQLRKDKHSDMWSFNTVIARVLSKQYIPDGTKVTTQKQCLDCKSAELSYQQGCITCMNCGSSKCS